MPRAVETVSCSLVDAAVSAAAASAAAVDVGLDLAVAYATGVSCEHQLFVA